MEIDFNARFKKQYKKLPQKIRKRFLERLDIFKENPHHPLLRVHKLKGDMVPFESINVTGDIRALFIQEGTIITFYEIGTHSDLY